MNPEPDFFAGVGACENEPAPAKNVYQMSEHTVPLVLSRITIATSSNK